MKIKPLYHVEEVRKGCALSEARWGVYGNSTSPHPYSSHYSIEDAQRQADEWNRRAGEGKDGKAEKV
jgi:hypothetical protein